MCLDLILNLFRKQPVNSQYTPVPPVVPAQPPVVVPPVVVPPMSLPHPEEKPDSSQTMTTPGLVDAMFQKWYDSYNVPIASRDYFRNKVIVQLDDTLTFPAGTWTDADGIRHLKIKPEWCNAGVLAHEQAHNSYALLTDEQKAEFSVAYNAVKGTDPYIKLLYSINTYGLSSDVEAHAELGRYLWGKLPESLLKYYPRLLE